MIGKYFVRLVSVILPLVCFVGCSTPTEVQEMGSLVVRYSQRLNVELQDFEKSLEELWAARAKRIADRRRKTKANQAFVTATKRVWSVSKNTTAEHMFKSVRSSRREPRDFKQMIQELNAKSEKRKKEKLYDPEPIETTIKRVIDLTKEESLKDRAKFASDFAKDIWSQLKKKQEEAKGQAKTGDMTAEGVGADAENKVNSSAK